MVRPRAMQATVEVNVMFNGTEDGVFHSGGYLFNPTAEFGTTSTTRQSGHLLLWLPCKTALSVPIACFAGVVPSPGVGATVGLKSQIRDVVAWIYVQRPYSTKEILRQVSVAMAEEDEQTEKRLNGLSQRAARRRIAEEHLRVSAEIEEFGHRLNASAEGLPSHLQRAVYWCNKSREADIWDWVETGEIP